MAGFGKCGDVVRAEPSFAPPGADAPSAAANGDACAQLEVKPSGNMDRMATDPALYGNGWAQSRSMTSRSNRARTHEDNDAEHGVYPKPKWPVGHQSSTFEAMAVKKAMILAPAEIYAECTHHGAEKANFHWLKMLMLSAVAGCYVGFGFSLCLMVGGNTPKSWQTDSPGLFQLVFGAVGFPFAFTMIVVCGAELYTSMCAYSAAAWWEGKIGVLTVLRLLALTWCGNFAGTGIFVGLMYGSGVYEGRDWYTLLLGIQKTHHPWGQVIIRGIFANWLVGIATWQANAAQDLTGKAVAVWLPISAFAMMGGLEHCIANMFVIPMSIALGNGVNAREFVWRNLIPATLGNWIGGAICVATVYAFTYGSPGKKTSAWLDDHLPSLSWGRGRASQGTGSSKRSTPAPQ